eukprot:gene25220-biopygen7471
MTGRAARRAPAAAALCARRPVVARAACGARTLPARRRAPFSTRPSQAMCMGWKRWRRESERDGKVGGTEKLMGGNVDGWKSGWGGKVNGMGKWVDGKVDGCKSGWMKKFRPWPQPQLAVQLDARPCLFPLRAGGISCGLHPELEVQQGRGKGRTQLASTSSNQAICRSTPDCRGTDQVGS